MFVNAKGADAGCEGLGFRFKIEALQEPVIRCGSDYILVLSFYSVRVSYDSKARKQSLEFHV
jgi:hypothetical protein